MLLPELFLLLLVQLAFGQDTSGNSSLIINEDGYFEMPGLNIMVFDDFYPEGHQSGLTILGHSGTTDCSDGDVRLEPTPGQWSPTPKLGNKTIDKKNGIIKAELWYPDSSKNERGFNPIDYPHLIFKYVIETQAIGSSIKVTVNLEKPLPDKWANKVGFNLELFPGQLFGEHYFMDDKTGIFPRQGKRSDEKR